MVGFAAWLALVGSSLAAQGKPTASPVRPLAVLHQDRLAIASRAREEAQLRYAQGLASTSDLLRWDRRLVEAYLEACDRDRDRRRGYDYLADKAAAIRDFEQRRSEARSGRPTPELLEANYILAWARCQGMAATPGDSARLAQARSELTRAAQAGYSEQLRSWGQDQGDWEQLIVWSKRWFSSAWHEAADEQARRTAAEQHRDRLAEIERLVGNAPAQRSARSGLDAGMELACRRAEAELYLAEAAQLPAVWERYLDSLRRLRDHALAAAEEDRLGVEETLQRLERWFEAEWFAARDRSQKQQVLDVARELLKDFESGARRRLQEGSRRVAEPDLYSIAYVRWGLEIRQARLAHP